MRQKTLMKKKNTKEIDKINNPSNIKTEEKIVSQEEQSSVSSKSSAERLNQMLKIEIKDSYVRSYKNNQKKFI